MNYLAIDTSGDYLTVIAVNGEKTSINYFPATGVRHSITLMPRIEEALNSVSLSADGLDFVCAAVGPGSFTGIRIGVSTAKGIADGLNKKVLSITTLKAIAYAKPHGKRLALVNAGHDHFYAEGYNEDQVDFEAKYISKEEVLELSKTHKLIANGPIDGLLCEEVDVSKGLNAAIMASLDKLSDDVNTLSPFYLRLSQAEEGRK